MKPKLYMLLISVIIISIMAFIVLVAEKCQASDFYRTFSGVGVYGGEQWQSPSNPIHHTSAYNWQEFQIRPIYGKHMDNRWDLWLEGNLGYIKWKNHPGAIKLGANVMTSYDVVKYKQYGLFGEFGIGLGWASYTPSTNLLRNNVLGLIDVGMGVKTIMKKGFILKIGPRFHHSSAVLARDVGINTFGIMVSLIR